VKDEWLQVEIEALAGDIALSQGAVEEGYRLVQSAAARLVGRDRLRAIQLLAYATLTGFGAGRLADMLATARHALDLVRPDDPPAAGIAAHTAYGCAAVMAALGDAGPRHLRAAEELFRGTELAGDPLLRPARTCARRRPRGRPGGGPASGALLPRPRSRHH
jgi:hypothetical protein